MLNVENKCELCRDKCCTEFKIGMEINDPDGLKDLLKQFPFIIETGTELVLIGGHERIVKIYSCTRFNLETSECKDYYISPRPIFCEETGRVPTDLLNCLLLRKD